MRMSFMAAIIACWAVCCAPPTRASIISGTYDFSASGLTSLFGTSVPPLTDPLVGSVTLTFDNSADISDTTSGIVASSVNVFLTSPIGYRYIALTDTLYFGGMSQGVSGFVLPGEADFGVVIASASVSPALLSALYTIELGVAWSTGTGTAQFIPGPPTSVDEPGTLAVLSIALGLVVLTRFRRQGANAADRLACDELSASLTRAPARRLLTIG